MPIEAVTSTVKQGMYQCFTERDHAMPASIFSRNLNELHHDKTNIVVSNRFDVNQVFKHSRWLEAENFGFRK